MGGGKQKSEKGETMPGTPSSSSTNALVPELGWLHESKMQCRRQR